MVKELEIKVVNTQTGEPEMVKINEANCWENIKKSFLYGFDKKAKRPVKMQLKMISSE